MRHSFCQLEELCKVFFLLAVEASGPCADLLGQKAVARAEPADQPLLVSSWCCEAKEAP